VENKYKQLLLCISAVEPERKIAKLEPKEPTSGGSCRRSDPLLTKSTSHAYTSSHDPSLKPLLDNTSHVTSYRDYCTETKPSFRQYPTGSAATTTANTINPISPHSSSPPPPPAPHHDDITQSFGLSTSVNKYYSDSKKDTMSLLRVHESGLQQGSADRMLDDYTRTTSNTSPHRANTHYGGLQRYIAPALAPSASYYSACPEPFFYPQPPRGVTDPTNAFHQGNGVDMFRPMSGAPGYGGGASLAAASSLASSFTAAAAAAGAAGRFSGAAGMFASPAQQGVVLPSCAYMRSHGYPPPPPPSHHSMLSSYPMMNHLQATAAAGHFTN